MKRNMQDVKSDECWTANSRWVGATLKAEYGFVP